MIKIPKELKEAICQIPSKEKDKLLLRLIAKDELLVAKLEHQLFGNKEETHALREEIIEEIKTKLSYYYDTPGWLMMAMRSLNAKITRHVKITKDKDGEVKLTIYLLLNGFKLQKSMLENKAFRAEKFAKYVIKRTEVLLSKLAKLHDDLMFDYKNDVEQLLNQLHQNKATSSQSKLNNIPKNWEDYVSGL